MIWKQVSPTVELDTARLDIALRSSSRYWHKVGKALVPSCLKSSYAFRAISNWFFYVWGYQCRLSGQQVGWLVHQYERLKWTFAGLACWVHIQLAVQREQEMMRVSCCPLPRYFTVHFQDEWSAAKNCLEQITSKFQPIRFGFHWCHYCQGIDWCQMGDERGPV